jgi:hypothetical protein
LIRRIGIKDLSVEDKLRFEIENSFPKRSELAHSGDVKPISEDWNIDRWI